MALTRRTALAAIMTYGVAAPLLAHPHHGDKDTLLLKGPITSIDLVNRTLALDAVDRATKRIRNFLVFLDPKIKLKRGKAKIALTDLTPRQRIICTVEIDPMPDADSKMVAFQIEIDLKALPATP
jgi:hypothetical protein